MEPFSNHHSTFLLDSTFLPNTPTALSCLLEGEDLNTSSVSYYPTQPLQEIPFEVRIQENNCLDNNTKSLSSDNESPVTKTNKADSSSMVLELENDDQASQKEIPIQKKRKNKYGSCLSSVNSQVAKEAKAKRQKKSSSRKETEEMKRRANEKQQSNVPQEASNSYIHVRARRGEATDNHSLAERVRREKISVRMKLLEDIVPGCDKVVGKAHILDNIINYVQTLQYQVEFLSMKLASLNSMSYEFAADLDPFMVKSEKLSSLASPLPSMHQLSPPNPIDFTDTTTTLTTRNNYSLMDNSISFLYQQGQRTNTFSQDNENLLWDVDDQRQTFISQVYKEIQKQHLQ